MYKNYGKFFFRNTEYKLKNTLSNQEKRNKYNFGVLQQNISVYKAIEIRIELTKVLRYVTEMNKLPNINEALSEYLKKQQNVTQIHIFS